MIENGWVPTARSLLNTTLEARKTFHGTIAKEIYEMLIPFAEANAKRGNVRVIGECPAHIARELKEGVSVDYHGFRIGRFKEGDIYLDWGKATEETSKENV